MVNWTQQKMDIEEKRDIEKKGHRDQRVDIVGYKETKDTETQRKTGHEEHVTQRKGRNDRRE